jgi:DNA-binding transcriptional LysR family regulator
MEEMLPLALSRTTCAWRRAATEQLDSIGRPYRIAFCSGNAGAISAAVLAGLAISASPESGLRPGMRVLTPGEGFPDLPPCRVGLVRNPHGSSALTDALAGHIISSLDNLSPASQEAAE